MFKCNKCGEVFDHSCPYCNSTKLEPTNLEPTLESESTEEMLEREDELRYESEQWYREREQSPEYND